VKKEWKKFGREGRLSEDNKNRMRRPSKRQEMKTKRNWNENPFK
jgi:hypothetical protein